MVAAREFAIPVICIATTYMLTPIFAHTQEQLLSQLNSPSEILPYNTNVDTDNVEVSGILSSVNGIICLLYATYVYVV